MIFITEGAFCHLLSGGWAVAWRGPGPPWPWPSHRWRPQSRTCSPLLFPQATRRLRGTSASCQSLLLPTEKQYLLPSEKGLSDLFCSCQPMGDRSRSSPPSCLACCTTATASLAFQCCSSYFYTQFSNVSAHGSPPSSSVLSSWPASGEGR